MDDLKCTVKKKPCPYLKDKRHYHGLTEPSCTVHAHTFGQGHELSKMKKCPFDVKPDLKNLWEPKKKTQ